MKPIHILGTVLFVIIAVIMTANSVTRTVNVVSPQFAFAPAEIELCAEFVTSENGVEPEIECDEISTAQHHRAHPILKRTMGTVRLQFVILDEVDAGLGQC